jgi:hypothetical protein
MPAAKVRNGFKSPTFIQGSGFFTTFSGATR